MGHAHIALLERAFEVDGGDLIAEVGGLVDQRDETVLHGQGYLGACIDVFAEDTGRGDVQGGAAGRNC